jgi:formiminoglutamase
MRETIAQRHQHAKQQAKEVLQLGGHWLALGGGHDYAYADGAAFIENCQSQHQRPLIINIDAHLDVRPLEKGLSSGTPFFRLLSDYQNFDFAEIGIQVQSASRQHRQWVEERGGIIIGWDELLPLGEKMFSKVASRLASWLKKPRPLFLSIDLDSFSSAYAMGCSQSFPTGFSPAQFWPIIEMLLKKTDLHAVGLYEVSPPLDIDQRTSCLAALIAHKLLFSGTSKNKTTKKNKWKKKK